MVVCLPIVLPMAGRGIAIGTKKVTEDEDVRVRKRAQKRDRGLFTSSTHGPRVRANQTSAQANSPRVIDGKRTDSGSGVRRYPSNTVIKADQGRVDRQGRSPGALFGDDGNEGRFLQDPGRVGVEIHRQIQAGSVTVLSKWPFYVWSSLKDGMNVFTDDPRTPWLYSAD